MKQTSFLRPEKSDYGGSLLKTRYGRSRPRPLDTRNTMHLILRSTKARGVWSFRTVQNERKIKAILKRFSERHGVRIQSFANVGNHLHLQIKLSNRYRYQPFICAVTAAIAMAVSGASRRSPMKRDMKRGKSGVKERFWDLRPFTRIVTSLRAVLNLRDYIRINGLEGQGFHREEARWMIAQTKRGWNTS